MAEVRDDDNIVHLRTVHPVRPEIDGVCFSDIYGLPEALIRDLCDREVVFITEFSRNGKTYGGHIIAKSLEQAEKLADERPWGEEVLGTLQEVLPG